MKTLLNQFNSQLEKNNANSISSNLIADINTVIQMSTMLDDKSHSNFLSSVISEFRSLVSHFSAKFADYVTEQNVQEVSDKKTK